MLHNIGRHSAISQKNKVVHANVMAIKTYLNFPPDGTQSYYGYEVTLFKALAGHLKFNYIIREPQPYPGFKGILAEVRHGLSDIGWSQLYFDEWRWKRFDLTTSYDEDQHCLMVNFLIFIIASST